MAENETESERSARESTSSWPGGRYVVGMDGSDPSRDALRSALDLAALTGASVEAITVWQYPPFYGPGLVPSSWSPEEDARSILDDAVQAVVGETRPAKLTTLVGEGVTTQVLLDLSRDADLLVLGSRGHGGFAGLLLGSVSSACAEHATCPVLIVHRRA